MSYSTMYGVPQTGPVEVINEFRNSWGSAARIWRAIGERYLSPNFSMFFDGGERLWRLHTDPRLSEDEQLVLRMTYDRFWVRRCEIPRMVVALRRFVELYPTPGCVDHLPAIATALEGLDERFVGACFWWTSVGDDFWTVRDGEDDYREFDLSRDPAPENLTDLEAS